MYLGAISSRDYQHIMKRAYTKVEYFEKFYEKRHLKNHKLSFSDVAVYINPDT